MSDEQDPPALSLRPRKKPADDEAAADSKDAQTEKPKLSLKPKTDSASSEAPSLSLKPKTAEPAKESPPQRQNPLRNPPNRGLNPNFQSSWETTRKKNRPRRSLQPLNPRWPSPRNRQPNPNRG